MSIQELYHQAVQLSLRDRFTLIDALLKSIQSETESLTPLRDASSVREILAKSRRQREHLNQATHWLDSTALIREDRDR
jgi:hypothetical protein